MARNIDTTIFSADFRVLEIRINELWDCVDEFVVCESNFSHSGKEKNLLLSDNDEFTSKYSKKLRVITYVVDKPHENARIQEQKQRQRITDYLQSYGLNKDDRIIHSDCDEIIEAETIENSRKLGSDLLVQLRNYTYFLNLRQGFWNRGRIVSGDKFKSIQHMRRDIFLYELSQYRRFWNPIVRVPDFWITRTSFLNLPQWVGYRTKLKLVEDSGWHFNNLMKDNEISKKVQWSSHVELADPNTWDANRIRRSRLNREDVYFGKKFELEDDIDLLPRFVKSNLDDWSEFLLD